MPKGKKKLSKQLLEKYPDLKDYYKQNGRLNKKHKAKIFKIITEEEKEEFIKIFMLNKFKGISITEVNMEDKEHAANTIYWRYKYFKLKLTLPVILLKIRLYLLFIRVQCHQNVEGEGRAASLIDEGTIKQHLKNKFNNRIIDQEPRRPGDILVLDYDNITNHPINIKTSLGGTDNCFSKAGFVYAFTDLSIDEIPIQMNFKKMNELINTHRIDNKDKDYWFLCIDKNTSDVMVRGTKQINNWVVNINPSNILQVNWAKEKKTNPIKRDFEEAYKVLIQEGVIKSLNGFRNSLPDSWIN